MEALAKTEYEYEIEPDYQDLKIRMGKWEFDCTERSVFHRGGSILNITHQVLKSNGFDTINLGLGESYQKGVNQTFTEKFKIRPRVFVDMVNKLHYKILVRGLGKSVLHSVCYAGPHNRKLEIPPNFREVKPMLVQCVEDGIPNIAPLVAATEMGPKELKTSIGKGAWKKYCKRSLTANAIVASKWGSWYHIVELKRILQAPVTFLKYTGMDVCEDIFFVVARLVKETRTASDPVKTSLIKHTVRDTKSMARDLNQPFNPDWSWNRMQEEHDRLTLLQLEEEYSTEVFPCEGLPETFDCTDGTAKRLMSELEVAREGRLMHHCVAGYARRCSRGHYAVYHVTDKDGSQSTLGMLPFNGTWVVNQHYSYHNGTATNAASSVAQELYNSLPKTEGGI